MNLVENNTIAFDKLREASQLYILKTIKKHADDMPKIEADTLRQVEFLKANGFVEEVHFKWGVETYKRQDYVYCGDKAFGGDRFYFEYDVKHSFIALMSKRFGGEDGMYYFSANIEIEDGRLIKEQGSIMGRRGTFKPKTILDKLTYLNELANNMEASYNSRISTLELTMKEYAIQYPTAKVTTHKNYNWRNNNYNSNADVIQVLFPSGSHVNIVVTNKVADVIKSHDAEAKILTLSETLDKFSKQEPIGVKETA